MKIRKEEGRGMFFLLWAIAWKALDSLFENNHIHSCDACRECYQEIYRVKLSCCEFVFEGEKKLENLNFGEGNKRKEKKKKKNKKEENSSINTLFLNVPFFKYKTPFNIFSFISSCVQASSKKGC